MIWRILLRECLGPWCHVALRDLTAGLFGAFMSCCFEGAHCCRIGGFGVALL